MCGICGIWHFDPAHCVEEQNLRALADPLVHRGPDAVGFHVEGSLGLAVRRLSIVDPNGSQQPISNEDQRLWLVCNGEIYNYRSLRAQLSGRHQFRTDGDVETILHLYEDHRLACVDHLRGMFAWALWDSNRQQLTLAVDRFGKKPLYFWRDAEKIVFASELKAVIGFPGIPRELDYEALDQYLACGYISAPRSIFKGILKLCAGQRLVVRRDADSQAETYWQPMFASVEHWDRRPLPVLAEELRHLLTEAIRIRLPGDVPTGAFLSGGLDSTAVVGLITQVTDQPVKTFSIGFAHPSYDESPYAQAAASFYHTEHYAKTVLSDSLDLLPELVRHYDEPFADSSMIPTYLLSQFARQQVKVVLSGDGGDEVFAGYHQHLYAARQRFLQSFIPASLNAPLAQIVRILPVLSKITPYLTDQPAQRWLTSGFFTAFQRSQLYCPETRQKLAGYEGEQVRREAFRRAAHLDEISQLQYHDLTVYLPGDILVKLDRASMFASLEVRSPLLDHLLFEFMARVPVRYRVGVGGGKLLLKKALAGLLPPFVDQRKKQGFSIPQSEWMRPLLPSLVGAGADISSLFDSSMIAQMLAEHSSGQVDHKDRLWALLCLSLWLRDHDVRL
ncbi:MAG: asparagine synthase (glutamine-hydrolyzing) [Chloroflexota bacterium]